MRRPRLMKLLYVFTTTCNTVYMPHTYYNIVTHIYVYACIYKRYIYVGLLRFTSRDYIITIQNIIIIICIIYVKCVKKKICNLDV